jgi:hypothetical protein
MPDSLSLAYEASSWAEFKNAQGRYECPECARAFRGKQAMSSLARHMSERHGLHMVTGCGLLRGERVDGRRILVTLDEDCVPAPSTVRRTTETIAAELGRSGLPVCRQRVDEQGRVYSMVR